MWFQVGSTHLVLALCGTSLGKTRGEIKKYIDIVKVTLSNVNSGTAPWNNETLFTSTLFNTMQCPYINKHTCINIFIAITLNVDIDM